MLRSWRAREWLILAACLTILGLGLPVGSWEIEDSYLHGSYNPGYCVTSYDYNGGSYLECTAGTISPSIYLAGSQGSLTAAKSGIRVFVALAVVLAVLAVRRNNRLAAQAAVVTGVVGILRYAVPPQPGNIVFALALLALCLALQERRLIRLPHRLRSRLDGALTRTPLSAPWH